MMQKMMFKIGLVFLATTICSVPDDCNAQDDIASSLLFHASFDKTLDADHAKGDPRLYTASNMKREVVTPGIRGDAVAHDPRGGRTGGALRFNAKQEQLIFYKGGQNVPFSENGFEGTVSFWMRLSPADDLPDGYVDPLQITDKAWNNSSFFVDFTEKNPRSFRLGVFSEYKFWNPTDRKWDDISDRDRPMVTVTDLPFTREAWTHVAFVFRGFNQEGAGEALLYLNGSPQGSLEGQQQFRWESERIAIMLGINYVGWIDDLRIYSRSLSEQQIRHLGE